MAEAQDVLDLGAAIRNFGGKQEGMRRAARAFVDSYGMLPARCAVLAAAGDTAELGRLAHMIKGAGKLLGAHMLSAAAGELEDAERDGLPAAVLALAPLFVSELEQALDAMRLLRPEAPPVRAPADLATALRLAERLRPLLEAGDYAAREVLDQLDAALAGSPYAHQAAAIGRQFDELETEHAAALAGILIASLRSA
ncbi:MAG TPA: Hpt domain-containing protein [Telluria sp.]|nr:Hpt domain-containing protein [Telluria sp.]